MGLLALRTLVKGKRSPLVKGREIKGYFFQETSKTEGAACATFDLGKHRLLFCFKKQAEDEEGEGGEGASGEGTGSGEDGGSEHNKASGPPAVGEEGGCRVGARVPVFSLRLVNVSQLSG